MAMPVGEVPDPIKISDKVVCQACKAERGADDNFCRKCGHAFATIHLLKCRKCGKFHKTYKSKRNLCSKCASGDAQPRTLDPLLGDN